MNVFTCSNGKRTEIFRGATSIHALMKASQTLKKHPKEIEIKKIQSAGDSEKEQIRNFYGGNHGS